MILPFYDNLWNNASGIFIVKVRDIDGFKKILEKELEFNFSETINTNKTSRPDSGNKRINSSYVRIKGDILEYIDYDGDFKDLILEFKIDNVNFEVNSIYRPRNLDGSINHTKLELI